MFSINIGNTIRFHVKLSFNDAGVTKDFPFWFDAKRVHIDALKANMEENGDLKVIDFHMQSCRDNLTGWSDQRLVMGDDGQPAPFGPEALEMVLNLAGAATLIHNAYMEAIAASNGKAGRAKN